VLFVQVEEGWSGYVAAEKKMHENSAVVERYRERVPGFLCFGMDLRRALSRGVEQAQMPWVWSDPRVGESVVLWEQLAVLGKRGKKVSLVATRLAVGHLL
jgi:hypothetical protein